MIKATKNSGLYKSSNMSCENIHYINLMTIDGFIRIYEEYYDIEFNKDYEKIFHIK